MAIQHNPYITELSWDEIRLKVRTLDAALVDIIDKIAPTKDLALVQVRYPFGANITTASNLNLPNSQGNIVPATDCDIPVALKKQLLGNSNLLPLSMQLSNTAEIYIQFHNHVLPWSLSKPGQFMTLWRQFDNPPYYHPAQFFHVTAGARSLFMAPNIGDNTGHYKLKRTFNLKAPAPHTLLEEWVVFKELANHPDIGCDWSSELLLFPDTWMQKIKKDPAWLPLRTLIYKKALQSSEFSHNQVFYNFAFSQAQIRTAKKADPYLIDTAKHLIAIACYGKPGFRPCTDNSAGPISTLQRIYTEYYGLKKYAPVFLQPDYFTIMGEPVYYSLQNPTALEFSPKNRRVASTIANLNDIRIMLERFAKTLQSGEIDIHNTILEHVVNQVQFDYFHTKPSTDKHLRPSREIVEEDPRMVGDGEFAESGTFFRGCIRIKR